jgi:hypothetical protein
MNVVATLALGLWPRQKGLQGCGPRDGSPGGLSKISESNFRGQNSMACGVLYIIGKILKRRCLKWARIAHLNI